MLKIENVVLPSLEQLKAVIRGMRNPMNSWDKSDSKFGCGNIECIDNGTTGCDGCLEFELGRNDLDLMNRLNKAGSAHAKYKRMIWVYADVVAPMYWWKEWDTYLHTVRNSCSTMHKIHAKKFVIDDFSYEYLGAEEKEILDTVLYALNWNRERFLETKDKEYWWKMIQMLPSSYNQRSIIMMNYETLTAIYRWRRTHKLDEWQTFCDWIESLPYSELITMKQPIGHDDEDDLK